MKYILSILFLVSSPCFATQLTCDSQVTRIHEVQGSNNTSPLVDQGVVIKGVVTGDFTEKKSLGGFFVQELIPDNDSNTSEGLFVRYDQSYSKPNVGDVVVINGLVSEQHQLTQVIQVKHVIQCQESVEIPAPVLIKMPLTQINLESLEGMLLGFSEPVVVSDTYNYLKFGEFKVSSELLLAPTAKFRPGKAANKHAEAIRKNQLLIDDGSLAEFPTPLPLGHDAQHSISASNTLQLGTPVQLTGIMHYAFGAYKIEPTSDIIFGQPIKNDDVQDVGGTLKVAGFNVQNYFTTIDEGGVQCGPLKNFSCRGADSLEEYHRQLKKLVAVINQANPDILGLQELENNQQSIVSLTEALNQDSNETKWAYIETGALGEDVIQVGLIYQLKSVKPVGKYALLNQIADPAFKEDKNRIVVAQTFADNDQKLINVATVHFKSKSCRDAVGVNLDQNDGQGCYNATRTEVAGQLARWMKSDPTGQQAKVSVLVGDFNSYQQEDPIIELKEAGFINLADKYLPELNWTTSYQGRVGALDHILVNQKAFDHATGMVQWHINSIEMRVFGYNMEPLSEDLKKPDDFYNQSPKSSSDHDWVMAGFEL